MNEHDESIFANYYRNFFNFSKRVGKPLLPSDSAPKMSPEIHVHPKNDS